MEDFLQPNTTRGVCANRSCVNAGNNPQLFLFFPSPATICPNVSHIQWEQWCFSKTNIISSPPRGAPGLASDGEALPENYFNLCVWSKPYHLRFIVRLSLPSQENLWTLFMAAHRTLFFSFLFFCLPTLHQSIHCVRLRHPWSGSAGVLICDSSRSE